MNPRVDYEMSEEDYAAIISARRPMPVMFLSGGTPIGGSQQENANAAWAALGAKMGFDAMTVRPGNTGNKLSFTAVPSETEAQRDARVARGDEERRRSEIARLTAEIAERQQKLAALNGDAP